MMDSERFSVSEVLFCKTYNALFIFFTLFL